MDFGQWRHSIPVEPHLVQDAGVFTVLPVRRHKNADIARKALEGVVQDWRNAFGDVRDRDQPLTDSKDGEVNGFVVPEALPERLAVATRLNDLGFLHDDMTEPMDQATALEMSRDFDNSLDLQNNNKKPLGAYTASYKKIMTKCLHDIVCMDREGAAHLLELYSKTYLQKVHQEENYSCHTWSEFEKRRVWDAGLKVFFAIILFASGFRVSADERQLSDHLLQLLEKAGSWMNDYYSFDKEYYMHRVRGVRIFNAVHFLMEHEHLPLQAAKNKVREITQKLEHQFLQEKEKFYCAHPTLSMDHKRHIEHCAASVGGAHYWSAISERYQHWKTLPGAQSIETLLRPPIQKPISDTCPLSEDHINGTRTANGQTDNVQCEAMHKNKRRPSEADVVALEKPMKRQKTLHQIEVGNGTPKILSDSVIQAPVEYIRSLPSKGVRRLLIESFDEWLRIPKQAKEIIITIVDLLHNSSLMLDDCEDGSDLRRGKPATHKVFGQAQTINTAIFMFVRAVQEAAGLTLPESVNVLSNHLELLSIGQSWDLHWREQCHCPTAIQYLDMVDKKTGGLFALLTDLMQLESPHDSNTYDLDGLVHCLGRYFQIRDDYVNLTSKEYSEQKGFCEDLDEGKISYPIVLCAALDKPSADQILGIFRQQGLSSQQEMQRQTKVHVVKLLENSGALEATKVKIKELEAVVDLEIEKLEGIAGVENPMLKVLVEMLRV